MNVTCIVYNSEIESILVLEKDKKYSFPSQSFDSAEYNLDKFSNYLQTSFKITAQASEFNEIFSSQQETILLLQKNEAEEIFGKWKTINDLKIIPLLQFSQPNILKYVFNYFFRLDKLKKESLFIFLDCSSKAVLKKCQQQILTLNPGISFEKNTLSKLGITIVETKSDLTEIIQLDVDKDLSERKIYKNAMEKIATLYSQKVIQNTRYLLATFYGFAGMTESGKSYFSRYVDSEKNFWNLKIRAFIENAKCLVDEKIPSLLEITSIQLLIDFAGYHYFKSSLVIESIYSKNFHDLLRKILKEHYQLIYIDASLEKRKSRSLDSETEFIKKDIKKENLGMKELKEEADLVIDNSGLLSDSKEQLNHYLKSQKMSRI